MSRRQAYARVSEGMASMPSRGLVLATAAVTFLVFSPVLGGAFLNWDDDRSLLASRLLSIALPAAAAAAHRAGAIVAVLVFGIHPLRVESVGWITDRGDVLCATFYLLAVLAYVRFALGSGRERRRWLIASLAAFAAALLSKEIAMTLPLSLLLLDAYPLRRWAQGLRAVVMEKASYLVLAAIGAAVAVFAKWPESTSA